MNETLQTISNIAVALGIFLTALGGYGSYHFGKKVDKLKETESKNREAQLNSQIEQLEKKTLEISYDLKPFIAKWADSDINDPRITDGAIVAIELKMVPGANYEGGIFEIVNRHDSSKNQICLTISDNKLLKLTLLDYKGEKYSTEGNINLDASKPIKIEALWSFKYNFIAIRFNDKIITSSQIPETKLDFASLSDYSINILPRIDILTYIKKFDIYSEKSQRFKFFDMSDSEKN